MRGPVVLTLPFTGRWLVQNSPLNRVPSHGTHRFATTYAIDFVPVDADGLSAPFTLSSLVRPEPPEGFAGFGRAILSPVAGTVLVVHDAEPDHAAFRGLPSVRYALTQPRRAASGWWVGLAGNHVVIEAAEGVLVALCHLRQGTAEVSPGHVVGPGSPVGQCGNSGNSTEPHLHVQAMDREDPQAAVALPITFPGGLPRNGEVIVTGDRD